MRRAWRRSWARRGQTGWRFFLRRPKPAEDSSGQLVSAPVQFRIGPFMSRSLDGDVVWIFPDLTFKAIADRLLDLIFRKCSKRVDRTNAVAVYQISGGLDR